MAGLFCQVEKWWDSIQKRKKEEEERDKWYRPLFTHHFQPCKYWSFFYTEKCIQMWKCKVNSGLEICNFWPWDLVLISEMDQEANVALCNLVPLGLLGIQLFRGVRGKCSLGFICSRGSSTCIVVCLSALIIRDGRDI